MKICFLTWDSVINYYEKYLKNTTTIRINL
jgi:hypothetical protein